MKRILCVSLTGMGNGILYLPVVRSLRARYPDAIIDLMVSSRPVEELFQSLPEINSVILFEKKKASIVQMLALARALRKNRYDMYVTSYLDKSLKVALFGFMLGIPDRIGFDNGFWSVLYTRTAREKEHKHEVEYNLDLLRATDIRDVRTSITLPSSAEDLAIAAALLPEVPGKRLIGFHPGSGTDLGVSVKRWGVEKYARLADMLAEKDQAEILIFGGPEEKALAGDMAARMRSVPRVLTGERIRTTAALMRRCDLFVSNDSGLMHLAAAVQVPVVGIFGPTLHWKNFPWQVPHAVVRSDMPCAPCYGFAGISCRDQRCLSDITVEHVYAQAAHLLSACRAGAR